MLNIFIIFTIIIIILLFIFLIDLYNIDKKRSNELIKIRKRLFNLEYKNQKMKCRIEKLENEEYVYITERNPGEITVLTEEIKS